MQKQKKTFSHLARLFTLVIVVVFSLINSSPVSLFAVTMTAEEKAAIESGAVWHVIDGVEDPTYCSGGTVLVPGSDNQSKVWNFMIGKGLKPWQAAGFMGNMQQEAHFEPRLVEYGPPWKNSRGEVSRPGKPSSLDDEIPPNQNSKGQPGYGIIQWTSPGRKQGLANKSKALGVKPSDLGLQLEYMWDELNGSYKKSTLDPLLASSTVEEATRIITYNYEIPANKEQKAKERTELARGFLAKFGSSQTAPTAGAGDEGTPATPTPATAGCDNGASSEALKNAPTEAAARIAFAAVLYSWPARVGKVPKPEYSAALAQFNPTARKDGADCGVFVSTVMRSTGADPNYPTVGTSVQMKYVKDNPDKYTVTNSFTLEDLRPGDILIVTGNGRPGHTYIFVGDQGGGKNKADASLNSRSANLGKAEVVDGTGRGHYTLARLKTPGN